MRRAYIKVDKVVGRVCRVRLERVEDCLQAVCVQDAELLAFEKGADSADALGDCEPSTRGLRNMGVM